jgi:hypothetical protein
MEGVKMSKKKEELIQSEVEICEERVPLKIKDIDVLSENLGVSFARIGELEKEVRELEDEVSGLKEIINKRDIISLEKSGIRRY